MWGPVARIASHRSSRKADEHGRLLRVKSDARRQDVGLSSV
jgi:hypothetical protein